MRIIRNNQKQFSINKEKLHILKNKDNEYIKKHYNDSLQKHSDVSKTLQLLRQNCQFLNIRQKIEIYIKKCSNCQKNKHATYIKYEEIQY